MCYILSSHTQVKTLKLIMLDIKLDHGWAGQLDHGWAGQLYQYWYHAWSWLISVLFMLDINVVRGWCIMLDQGLIEVDIKPDRTWRSMISSLIKLDASYAIMVDVSNMIYHDASSMNKVDKPSILMRQALSRLIVHQPLINLDINIDQGLMNRQPWSSMWDF